MRTKRKVTLRKNSFFRRKGKTILAVHNLSRIGAKKGDLIGIISKDENHDGIPQTAEEVVAEYITKDKYFRDPDFNIREGGKMQIAKKTRWFGLFQKGRLFAEGQIENKGFFFDTSADKARITEGTWMSYTDDFIINYDGKRRLGTISYSDKIDKEGYVSARVWYDRDRDGKMDKSEKVIAKYKAKAEIIYYELDYYSREEGVVQIDKKNGEFKLFYDDSLFGTGTIADKKYFFG